MNIDNKLFNIYLWDTIGQEKLKSLTKIFFKNAKIVILVYDITNKKSLEELNYWLKEVKESLGENIILGVLGNKKDLFVNEEVTEEQGQEYAKSIGARWGLTSAKTERESFITYVEDLIRDYIKKIEPEEKKEEDNKDNNLVLQNEDTEKKKKKKKCLFF